MTTDFLAHFQQPPGENRTYSSPRKYQLDLTDASAGDDPGTATEVWNYEQDQSILSPICSSVYEDAPLNYLIDHAFVGGFGYRSRLMRNCSAWTRRATLFSITSMQPRFAIRPITRFQSIWRILSSQLLRPSRSIFPPVGKSAREMMR